MAEFAATSVVDINESDLCRWLFAQPRFTADLCGRLGLTGALQARFEVPTTRLAPSAQGPGDVDILLCDLSQPARATVIEAKRIKISERTFASNAPTKLEACAKGVIQANLLGELGFHRTWLLVVVVTDGRERPGMNFFSRGITFDLMDVIRGHVAFATLASHVGLILVFLDQPVDKDISLAGGYGFDVRQQPTNSEQPAAVTLAVRNLFSEGAG